MKKSACVKLYCPGMVLFDPVQLVALMAKRGTTDTNIFDVFVNDEVFGRQAIEQGVVCPIYPISEHHYIVFVEDSAESLGCLPEPVFVHSGLPKMVSSGVLVVSDLNALLDWDARFFLNYKAEHCSRLPNNDYVDVKPGLYSLSVKGYAGLRGHETAFGYGLEFTSVQSLPKISDDASMSNFDFELVAR